MTVTVARVGVIPAVGIGRLDADGEDAVLADAVNVGVTPVASSYCPSLSKSHAYVSGPPSGSLDPLASRTTSVPSFVEYGPPASAVGSWKVSRQTPRPWVKR